MKLHRRHQKDTHLTQREGTKAILTCHLLPLPTIKGPKRSRGPWLCSCRVYNTINKSNVPLLLFGDVTFLWLAVVPDLSDPTAPQGGGGCGGQPTSIGKKSLASSQTDGDNGKWLGIVPQC